MNRTEAGIGSDILRGLSRKIDNKKRQLPIMRNWRDKSAHYSADLRGMIMLIYNHTYPEEEQGFFDWYSSWILRKIGMAASSYLPPWIYTVLGRR